MCKPDLLAAIPLCPPVGETVAFCRPQPAHVLLSKGGICLRRAAEAGFFPELGGSFFPELDFLSEGLKSCVFG